MNGDGTWRTRNLGDGPRPFIRSRIVNTHPGTANAAERA